jgi:transposase
VPRGPILPRRLLGRPKGKPAARLKLDAQEAVIRGYLAKGINKLAIAKLIECAPSTLYAWLARRNLRPSRGTVRVQHPAATP